jgi:hypothetical protein
VHCLLGPVVHSLLHYCRYSTVGSRHTLSIDDESLATVVGDLFPIRAGCGWRTAGGRVVPEPIDAAFSMAALESTGDPLPPAVHGACPFLISSSILSTPRANTPSLGDSTAIILP